MRIAMITGEYPPMEGGVGDFTRELGQALHQQGHTIHILTTMAEAGASAQEENGLIIDRQVHDWGWAAHNKIMRWLKATQPDIINIQYQAAAYQMRGGIDLFPRWQKRNLNAPIVTTFHDLLPPYLFPKAGALRQWAVWQLAEHANGVIVTNSADYTRLSQQLEKPNAPPIRLIHIGSNIAPSPPVGYERRAWRLQQGLDPETPILGFFGFINHSKGIETLLEAMAQLIKEGFPAYLLFIGGRTGSSDITNQGYAKEIDALMQELGLTQHIHHTGFTMPAEISAALLAADICALPYADGANLRRGTLHAALAHGCPIITTRPDSDTPQLRDGENILLIPPGDAQALARNIQRLWHNPELRAKLGQQAAALAAEFSWERIAAHTAEFFRELRK